VLSYGTKVGDLNDLRDPQGAVMIAAGLTISVVALHLALAAALVIGVVDVALRLLGASRD
jgi:hypothetical protein